jgi:recombinase
MLNHRTLTTAGMMKAIANGWQPRGPNAFVIPKEAALRGARLGGAKLAARARFYTMELGPRCYTARIAGASLQAIADALNADQYRTPTGKPWNPMQVSRVLARYKAATEAAIS